MKGGNKGECKHIARIWEESLIRVGAPVKTHSKFVYKYVRRDANSTDNFKFFIACLAKAPAKRVIFHFDFYILNFLSCP